MSYKAKTKSRVYLFPNTTSTISSGQIEMGVEVKVERTKDKWSYISTHGASGGQGWCLSSLLEKVKEKENKDDKDNNAAKTDDSNNVSWKGKVTADNGILYNKASRAASKIGTLKKDEKVEIDKKGKFDGINWWHIKGKGWYLPDSNKITLDQESTSTTVKDDSSTTGKDDSGGSIELPDSEAAGFQTSDNYAYRNKDIKSDDDAGKFILNSKTWMIGMPYQYEDICDPRLTGSQFGRKYASKIIENMPMMLVTPGKPKFLKGYSDADKQNVLAALADDTTGILENILKPGSSKNAKLYSLEFAYNEYWERVNLMCHKMAILLDLGDVEYGPDNQKLAEYRWENNQDTKFASFISSKESIAFYIESDNTVSESFSNSTGQSTMASTINQASDLARELNFLIGAGTGDQMDIMKSENYEKTLKDFEDITNKFSGVLPKSLLSRLSTGAATIASGGKMIFPEIWNDSEFSKSYSVTLKLRSPDCDKLSILLNIFIPLAHIIGLVAPAQLNGNGYTSPPLIRAYYKGFFDIDMGIITDIDISKGDKGDWTLDGLPTKVDVSISLKDLYNIFSLSRESEIFGALNNTAELDYLACLCGININKIDIGRTIDIYYYGISQGIVDKITFNHFLGVSQHLSNVSNDLLSKVGLART